MIIKQPETDAEIKEMWRLNHAVFAVELHQHEVQPDGFLVDKFHYKNIYRIAVDDQQQIAGMVCAHWEEPFSAVGHFGAPIAAKIIPDQTAEIRLFALRPDCRQTNLAIRLASAITSELARRNLKYLIISAVSSQKEFYEHLGLMVVGQPICDGETTLFPMFGEIDKIIKDNIAYRRYCHE